MKKNLISIICFISGFVYSQQSGSVGISKKLAFTPDAKAILDVESKEAGVLFPRLTTAQRNTIVLSTQEDGLLIYNTDVKCFEYYQAMSSAWKQMCAGSPVIPAQHSKLVQQNKNTKTTL
ncbi:hypothetical protein KB553_09830 [Chryseobacterium rhizoplanae]|uniref:hypothetical protein n=1 Tax=Chryseobacterium rhizoplanae TaxID=1609531 RepID=UPI001CE39C08|nr:hypothetical protein [Chryseobacterium rhizoplanae]UCA61803.1 hypothetical protein KB553_09830 [Chryseobacterium rhizoplanae]